MRVLCAPPVRGQRERFCSSDEAEVSVMRSGMMEGMVERLQKPAPGGEREGSFTIADFHGGGFEFIAGPSKAEYHVLKALSLGLAGVLFPSGFVDVAELRLSRGEGGVVAASYSAFVPDEGGAMARRRDAMERYYAATGRDEREDILFAADFEERRRNPSLIPQARKAGIAGLRVPHPEANYHVCSGRTVFFEVDSMDMRLALRAAKGCPDRRAMGFLAQAYATVMTAWMRSLSDHEWPPQERRMLGEYRRMEFGVLSSFVLGALEAGEMALEFIRKGAEFWKREPDLWTTSFRAHFDGRAEPAPAAGIDPGIFTL